MNGLVERVRAWARLAPTRTALADERAVLSYRALLQETLKLADRLASHGLSPRPRVAYVGPNRNDAVVALLASGLGEGTIVFVDPSTSPAAVARALAAYPCEALIDGREAEPTLTAVGPGSGCSTEAAQPADPRSVGAVVFTSGSTGEPKGVLVSRTALDASADVVAEYLGLAAHDAGALLVPISTRMGLSTVLAHLWMGSTLILGAGVPGGGGVPLGAGQPTSITCVPAHLRILLERRLLDAATFPRLRTIRVGAGAISPRDLARTVETLPGTEFLLTYGTSETGEISVARGADLGLPGCVGRPLPDVTISVLDTDGRRLPDGATGELAVASPRVMLGYHDSAGEDAGLHRTGDLGRCAGGRVYLSGRKKEMIKSGGETISPLAIERVLRDQPGVADATVFGVPDALLGEVPFAFVATHRPPASARPASDALRAACATLLSRLSVPRRILFVDQIPRLPSGKPDRSALVALAKMEGGRA